MRKPIPVTVVNLETGKRNSYPSYSAAANATSLSFQSIKKMMETKSAYKKWYVFRHGHDRYHEERIAYFTHVYADRYKEHTVEEGKMAKRDKMEKMTADETLVSLRIDSHTVIMVPRYKATEKYAQKYRERLEKARK